MKATGTLYASGYCVQARRVLEHALPAFKLKKVRGVEQT
jgi:hypothetical protein